MTEAASSNEAMQFCVVAHFRHLFDKFDRLTRENSHAPFTLVAVQARESLELEGGRSSRLLQEAHELIDGLSICDAFVEVFVDEDYRPASYRKRWKNESEKTWTKISILLVCCMSKV